MVSPKRTTSCQGTGGFLVRTSSSSQAGARSPLSATPGACHAYPSAVTEPTGVPLADVIAALEARYDPALAEDWDAVGLVCGDPAETVSRVLFAVDPVGVVVDEALDDGAQLLVTHHPLF